MLAKSCLVMNLVVIVTLGATRARFQMVVTDSRLGHPERVAAILDIGFSQHLRQCNQKSKDDGSRLAIK